MRGCWTVCSCDKTAVDCMMGHHPVMVHFKKRQHFQDDVLSYLNTRFKLTSKHLIFCVYRTKVYVKLCQSVHRRHRGKPRTVYLT